MRVLRLLVTVLLAAAAARTMRAQPPEPHALMPLPESVQFAQGAFTVAMMKWMQSKVPPVCGITGIS